MHLMDIKANIYINIYMNVHLAEFNSDIFTVILTKFLGYLQNIFPQGPYQNQFDGSDQSVIYPLTKEIPAKSTKKL